MNNNRDEARFLCADLVTVRIPSAAGLCDVVANLEEIAASGACILLEAAAVEGSDVEMICAKCRLKGKVRYCRFAGLGYDVGIEFNERHVWDRYVPKHLLEIPVGNRGGVE
jgi:hypothetical protein